MLAWVSATLGVMACIGCAGLAIIMDQTALAGNVTPLLVAEAMMVALASPR